MSDAARPPTGGSSIRRPSSGQARDGSVDGRDEKELYMQLLQERQRLQQRQHDDRGRQRKTVSTVRRPSLTPSGSRSKLLVTGEDGFEPASSSRPASRPSSSGSNAPGGVDRDTRGVLQMMNEGDPEQLSLLRQSLSRQVCGRVASPMVPPQPRRSRTSLTPADAAVPRPSSSSSAIANAIQAENARVKMALAEDGCGDLGASGGYTPSSRPSSRPNSSSRRLPITAEAAASSAPPSALGTGGTSGSKSSSFNNGYNGGTPPVLAGVSASAGSRPAKASASSNGYGAATREGSGTPVATGGRRSADEISERVSHIDRRKQKALLRMLDDLDPTSSAPGSPELRGGKPAAAGSASSALAAGVAMEPRRRPELEDDGDLRRSLQALEQFRSSQSRRFFAREFEQDDNVAGQSTRQPGGGKCNLEATPCFGFGGGTASTSNGVAEDVLTDMKIEGLDIAVRDFGDDLAPGEGLHDCLPGIGVLGSSLVAATLADMQLETMVIPTLPRGQRLVFNCVSTWGDRDFVGLAGIEVFDGRGFPVVLKDPKQQVVAEPSSINVLAEYHNDPRTADKLFDQVNFTRDDLHVWLAPFTPGQTHTVSVDLGNVTDIAMIRVWNYNKSRLHSSRGVKDLEILLDGRAIFAGEVRQALGSLTDPEQACEHILFTSEERVLEAIEEHDWLPAFMPVNDDEDNQDGSSSPTTAAANAESHGARPLTAGSAVAQAGGPESACRPKTQATLVRESSNALRCRSVTMVVHSTWGDPYYVGLTALEVLDASLTPVPLVAENLEARPRDLNDLEGVEGDPRTVDKLCDGTRCTTDDTHMWLAPLVKVSAEEGIAEDGVSVPRNILSINFGGEEREVAGFHLWNYNKSKEDTSRGLREFSVYCDDRYVATFLCRKAPGHTRFDFKQVVLLNQPPNVEASLQPLEACAVPRAPAQSRREPRPGSRERLSSQDGRRSQSRERNRSGSGAAERSPSVGGPGSVVQQQYETPMHPCGFVFKLVMLSTWSDIHYVGLDGIEFLGLDGRPLSPQRVYSSHGSVKNLPGMENDWRSEENLLHGAPGPSGRMWLAPFSRQSVPNSVEFVFDEPTRISCMHVWNYTRTPARGVRDVELYVDDILVYQGVCRQADEPRGPATRNPAAASAAPPLPLPPQPRRPASRQPPVEAVLFTTLPEVVEREQPYVYLPTLDQLVTFYDGEGPVDPRRRSDQPPGVPERPGTALLTPPLPA
eukprot:TRINITY_DN29084_c0_g1_i1.p1 TRINITY_DN29084_c0_g1~~TRINITY_DN29084_c0_g1_i1.p1  ORF type:complete len:1223 (+),score=256.63 TRINITY_DN29084_c0_g1_i1:68-3736(+)